MPNCKHKGKCVHVSQSFAHWEAAEDMKNSVTKWKKWHFLSSVFIVNVAYVHVLVANNRVLANNILNFTTLSACITSFTACTKIQIKAETYLWFITNELQHSFQFNLVFYTGIGHMWSQCLAPDKFWTIGPSWFNLYPGWYVTLGFSFYTITPHKLVIYMGGWYENVPLNNHIVAVVKNTWCYYNNEAWPYSEHIH
jgi:hypothetical protein